VFLPGLIGRKQNKTKYTKRKEQTKEEKKQPRFKLLSELVLPPLNI